MNEYRSIRGMHERGASIKLIAKELHMARNTVRKYLRNEASPEFHAPASVSPALAPFVKQVDDMKTKGYIGSRILRELRKQGYRGPQASFYRYLARLGKKTKAPEVILRFETDPAHQAQFDWAEYVIPGRDAPVKVYISSLILGYSRYRHYHVSLDITQASIFEAIAAGLTAFGGVPQEILFDNPKALVTRTRPHLVWNGSLLALAGHYSFIPRACWPYRAQTKGKVENPFRYLETQFIAGLIWAGFPDFVVRLLAFETEVNQRPHGTTGVPPMALLSEELPLLGPLPDHPFISPQSDFRHVSQDCLIAFQRRRYSVPWQYAGKTVWIKLHAGAELEVYSQAGLLLARHTLEQGPRRVIIDNKHYAGLREQRQQQKLVLAEAFKVRFPAGERFLEKLLAQYKFSATEQLRRILDLAEYYALDVMQAAFEQGLAHNTFSANFIRGILEQLTAADNEPGLISTPYQMPLPGLDLKPDLNRYQQLINRKYDPDDKEKNQKKVINE